MVLGKGFQFLILFYEVHLTTNEILRLPERTAYHDGTFYNVENQESKVVFLKTCQGGIFGFFQSTNTSSLVYEVKFRTFGIETGIWDQHQNMAKTTHPDLLPEESRFKPFYFQWANNRMVVGAGTVVGQGPKLQISNSATVTVRYISVRTGVCPLDFILELSCRKV
ncbi:hypothetical protein SNE40_000597 [Patella caerulea]|uniref:Farnesoic acid O-methyl transferase domain-containing protein n=1 Tax=Patella caerulea TaxID=87958 RepID=A0AAN8KAT2_PATCE